MVIVVIKLKRGMKILDEKFFKNYFLLKAQLIFWR